MIVVQAATLIACVVTSTPHALDARAAPATAHGRNAGLTVRADAQSAPAHDRIFDPDYSHALSVDQALRAWNDELNRINQPPVTGGG